MTPDGPAERVRAALTDLTAPIGAPSTFTSDDIIRRGRGVRRRRRTFAAVGAVAGLVVAVAAAGVFALRPAPDHDPAPVLTPPPATSTPSSAPASTSAPASSTQPTSSRPPARTSTYPDASNTGVPAGTALTRHTGDVAIRENGTVVDGWDLTGSLDIYADNVTIRNSRITSSNWWGVNLRDGATGLRILHSTIIGVPGAGPDHGAENYGVISAGATVEVGFCDVSRFSTTLAVPAGSVHDNYLHGVQYFVGDGGRWQGTTGFYSGGGGPLTIRHNTVLNETPADKGATAAIGLFADNGPVSDVVVDDNVFGGGQYAFYGGGSGATRIRVTNNRFTTAVFPKGGAYGPVAAWNPGGTGNVWSGNVWADGPAAGRPVTIS